MEKCTPSIHENIKHWVVNNLSLSQGGFGGLPPCPYASEALLKKQVSLLCILPEDVFEDVEKALRQFSIDEKKMYLLVIENGFTVDVDQTQKFVKTMREKYFMQDLWLLYDHPALKETVGELNLNHGRYLLFMVQRLSELVQASRDLKKTGYYQSWEPTYFDEVVGLRERYFERMRNSTQLQESL